MCRKIGHRTMLGALEQMKKVLFRNEAAGHPERSRGLNVYRCPVCLRWHFGHRGEKEKGAA